MVDPLLHHRAGEIGRIATTVPNRDHRDHTPEQWGWAKHDLVPDHHHLESFREDIGMGRQVDGEALGDFLVPKPLPLANRRLRQHPRAHAFRAAVGRRIARIEAGGAGIQARNPVPERRLLPGNDFPDDHPTGRLGRGRVGRHADLLDAEGLTADVAQRLPLPRTLA